MKNRLLPLALFTFFLGWSCLLFAGQYTLTSPDNDPKGSDLRLQKIRSNQHTGVIDPSDVLTARIQREQLIQKSATSLGMNWMSAGPNNWAGRSRVVLFDNQDPTGNTMYTGGVTGGVYKSINKGLTWNILNTASSEVLRVSTMVQTPNGTLYAGTGEVFCDGYEHIGTGIYRSTDGLNFVKTSAPWNLVVKMACDPNNGRLFAAVESGLFYSDNGDTWNQVMAGVATEVVVGTNGTVLFVIDQHVVLAPLGDLANLTDLSTGAANMLPNANVGWTSLAIAPSNPDVMYAGLARTIDNTLLGIYTSNNGGLSWMLIFPPNPSYDPYQGNGCFANSLEVFPNNPYVVLLGGVAGWLGQKVQETGYYDWQQVNFSGFGPSGNFCPLFHFDYAFNPANPSEYGIATINGICLATITSTGFTYYTSNKNLETTQFINVAMGSVGNWMLGGANFAGNQMFNAVHQNNPKNGYLLPSTYLNGTYCQWSQLKPNYIFFSGQDFDTHGAPYVRSEDLGETTALTFLGGISSSSSDFLPSILWETDNFAFTEDTVWLYARNGTIEADSTVLVKSMNCYQCDFEYKVPVTIPKGDSLPVLDPYHSRFLLYGTLNATPGIYMTQDAIKFYKDPEWHKIGIVSDIITCLAASGDINYVWAGAENGSLYRYANVARALDSTTADVGSQYCIVAATEFNIPEMEGRYITNIAVDPKNDNNVLITLGNYGNTDYVFMTQNGLDSLPVFVSKQGNLPTFPVYDGLIEMHENGTAILATDMGIFTTTDIFAASPVWSADLNGMGDVPVMDLKQQTWENFRIKNLGYIAAASYGRGLFYDTTFHMTLGVDPGNGNASADAFLRIHPNPVRNITGITYTLNESAQVTVSVYDLTGRVVLTREFGQQTAGTHTSELNLGSLPNGTYLVKVNGKYGKVVKVD